MKKNIFIAIACITIFSCSREESQLDRTIFIPDEMDSNLPAYTESGYNVFGAKYERTYFKANQNIVPCKIMYSNDSTRLLMQGLSGNYPQQEMSLTFTFPSEHITNYNDLIIFHKKVVDLSNGCVVKMITNSSEKTLDVISGDLNFKRAQRLSVDDVENRIILSGTFEFQLLGTASFPEKFSNGRFDFGITKNEFYRN